MVEPRTNKCNRLPRPAGRGLRSLWVNSTSFAAFQSIRTGEQQKFGRPDAIMRFAAVCRSVC
jgi:hypothetical protein